MLLYIGIIIIQPCCCRTNQVNQCLSVEWSLMFVVLFDELFVDYNVVACSVVAVKFLSAIFVVVISCTDLTVCYSVMDSLMRNSYNTVTESPNIRYNFNYSCADINNNSHRIVVVIIKLPLYIVIELRQHIINTLSIYTMLYAMMCVQYNMILCICTMYMYKIVLHYYVIK